MVDVVFVCGQRECEKLDPVLSAVCKNIADCAVQISIVDDLSALKGEVSPSVLLLKNSVVFQNDAFLPSKTIVVFDGENHRISSFLKVTGGYGVDYGTSTRATISLSSISETSAVVSLQRNLISVSGKLIEPCDIPIVLTQTMSPRQVLSSVAVLLLIDAPYEEGYRF